MGRSTVSKRGRTPAVRARTNRATRGVEALAAGATLSVIYLCGNALWHGAAHWPLGNGVLGVVLGLFVCSLPVRHFLDLLLYWRTEGVRFRSRNALSWWIAGNAAVLLVGWLVIVLGVTRFTAAGP